MTTELIKLESGISLPRPLTQPAKTIAKTIQKVIQILPNQQEAKAFSVACVVELNKIEQECDALSVVNAACNCAALGLIPGAARGHAYFVPKWNKKLKTNECQLWPGYKGYIHLAYQTGFLRDIESDVIFEGEECRFWRDDNGQHVDHDINSRLDLGETGRRIRGAYAVWSTRDGGRGLLLVPGKELYDLREKQTSGGKAFNVWQSDEIAMFRKTPIRRASKNWHLIGSAGSRFDYAVRLDEQSEREETQDRLYLPSDVQDAEVVPKTGGLLDDLDDDEKELASLVGSEAYVDFASDIEVVKDGDIDRINHIHQDIALAVSEGSITMDECKELQAMIKEKIPY